MFAPIAPGNLWSLPRTVLGGRPRLIFMLVLAQVIACLSLVPGPSPARAAGTAPETIALSGTIRDFQQSHPDFEANVQSGLDPGVVADTLGPDRKPVYAYPPPAASPSTTGRANFDQWYRDVSGVNRSTQHDIVLTRVRPDPPLYRYTNGSFFPIDGQLWGNEGQQHNYWFTYELHHSFTYQGGEVFDVAGDDDLWVFINNKRVIGLGGVHRVASASVRLDDIAGAIGLVRGQTYKFDLFFAERHTTSSSLHIETSIMLQPDQAYPWPNSSVVPVLFVPRDWKVSSPEVRTEAIALEGAMAEVRQFYANNVGGRTFRLNDLQVVQAYGRKESYGIRWNGRNIYEDGIEIAGSFEGSVVDELYRRGFPVPPAQNQGGYSTVIFVKGAGGYAGSRAFTQAVGGWSILGDWAIDSIQGQVAEGAYWWSGARKQRGAVAHELGHTFDLPHPDTYGYPNSSSVMGDWWNYPTVGLNDIDRQRLTKLRADFFTLIPPPGPSNLKAVAVDSRTILLTWSDNSTYEDGFRINNGVASRTTGPSVTGYTWGGLAPGTYMCFNVASFNLAGSSSTTPWACTTTTPR